MTELPQVASKKACSKKRKRSPSPDPQQIGPTSKQKKLSKKATQNANVADDNGDRENQAGSMQKAAGGNAGQAKKQAKKQEWRPRQKVRRYLRLILDEDQLETILKSDWVGGETGTSVCEVITRSVPGLVIDIDPRVMILAPTNCLIKPKFALEVTLSGRLPRVLSALSLICTALAPEQGQELALRYGFNEIPWNCLRNWVLKKACSVALKVRHDAIVVPLSMRESPSEPSASPAGAPVPAGQQPLRYSVARRNVNVQLDVAHVFMELDAVTRDSTGKAKSLKALKAWFGNAKRVTFAPPAELENMVEQLKTPAKETYWSAWLDWLGHVKSCALFTSAQRVIAASAALQAIDSSERRAAAEKEVDLLVKRHLRDDLKRRLKETNSDIEALEKKTRRAKMQAGQGQRVTLKRDAEPRDSADVSAPKTPPEKVKTKGKKEVVVKAERQD